MNELTAFQRDLLWNIRTVEMSGETPYGLEIKEQLEKYYEESVNHGRLYPNLDELSKLGYIEKGEVDRRTNSYVLTGKALEQMTQRQQYQEERLPSAEATVR